VVFMTSITWLVTLRSSPPDSLWYPLLNSAGDPWLRVAFKNPSETFVKDGEEFEREIPTADCFPFTNHADIFPRFLLSSVELEMEPSGPPPASSMITDCQINLTSVPVRPSTPPPTPSPTQQTERPPSPVRKPAPVATSAVQQRTRPPTPVRKQAPVALPLAAATAARPSSPLSKRPHPGSSSSSVPASSSSESSDEEMDQKMPARDDGMSLSSEDRSETMSVEEEAIFQDSQELLRAHSGIQDVTVQMSQASCAETTVTETDQELVLQDAQDPCNVPLPDDGSPPPSQSLLSTHPSPACSHDTASSPTDLA